MFYIVFIFGDIFASDFIIQLDDFYWKLFEIPQVHICGNSILLEMVGGAGRGDTNSGEEPGEWGKTRVCWWGVEHEWRSCCSLLLYYWPICMGSEVRSLPSETQLLYGFYFHILIMFKLLYHKWTLVCHHTMEHFLILLIIISIVLLYLRFLFGKMTSSKNNKICPRYGN